MKALVLFLTACYLLGCNKETNENPMISAMKSQKGYRNYYIGKFRCGLFVPPSYNSSKKYPFIIYLHGYSDTTTWNLEWYNEPIVSADPCIVLTPKCPTTEQDGWGTSWDPITSPMMEKTFEMINLVKQAFNLDTSRFYINGTSMGGFGTYGVLQKHPGMFAAAYVLCGGGNPDIAPLLTQTPLWIFHGSADQVVNVQYSRNLYNEVVSLGGTRIRYTEYPGVGHNVWDYTRYETTLSTWLLAQRKGSVHASPVSTVTLEGSVNPSNKPELHWTIPATELTDEKIWYCKVYRDGDPIADVSSNISTYTDTSVLAGSTHSYSLRASNYYFRLSPVSNRVVLTTQK